MESKKSKLTSEAKLLLVMGGFVLFGGAFMAVLNGVIPMPGGTVKPTPALTPPPPPKITRAVFDDLVKNARHVTGDAKAPVTIVEFADFQCPACRRAYEAIVGKIDKKEIPARYIFYQFPLPQIHERAIPAALAVEAAGKQGKFWPLYSVLFDGVKAPLDPDTIDQKAKSVGVDVEKMHQDVKDPALMGLIDQDRMAGTRAGVDQTPTFIVVKAGTQTDPDVKVGGGPLRELLVKMLGANVVGDAPPPTS